LELFKKKKVINLRFEMVEIWMEMTRPKTILPVSCLWIILPLEMKEREGRRGG